MGDAIFRDWRTHVETDGSPWYVISTEHGLLRPEDLVPDAYDRGVGQALSDPAFIDRLGKQLRSADLQPERCVVLDADWFQELVAKAFGVAKEAVQIRAGVSSRFRPRA